MVRLYRSSQAYYSKFDDSPLQIGDSIKNSCTANLRNHSHGPPDALIGDRKCKSQIVISLCSGGALIALPLFMILGGLCSRLFGRRPSVEAARKPVRA